MGSQLDFTVSKDLMTKVKLFKLMLITKMLCLYNYQQFSVEYRYTWRVLLYFVYKYHAVVLVQVVNKFQSVGDIEGFMCYPTDIACWYTAQNVSRMLNVSLVSEENRPTTCLALAYHHVRLATLTIALQPDKVWDKSCVSPGKHKYPLVSEFPLKLWDVG